METRTMTLEQIENYGKTLRLEERCEATAQKYVGAATAFFDFEDVFTEKFHFGRLVPPKVAQRAISEENRSLRVSSKNALFLIFAKLLKFATFHG